MFIRHYHIVIAIMSLTALFCRPDLCAGADRNTPLTKEQALTLLPQGPDMLDRQQVSNFQQLVSLGTNAYPALAEIVNDITDPIAISRILEVFAESQGDKAVAIDATKKLLVKYRAQESRDAVGVKFSAVVCLGRIGKPEDRDSIFPLLEDNDEGVRISALRALARLGNEGDVKRIQEFLEKCRTRLTADEAGKDFSLKEAEKVIGQLKQKSIPVIVTTNKVATSISPQ